MKDKLIRTIRAWTCMACVEGRHEHCYGGRCSCCGNG